MKRYKDLLQNVHANTEIESQKLEKFEFLNKPISNEIKNTLIENDTRHEKIIKKKKKKKRKVLMTVPLVK